MTKYLSSECGPVVTAFRAFALAVVISRKGSDIEACSESPDLQKEQ